MRYRSKATGAILEPRCEAVEAAMRESPGYEPVKEREDREPAKRRPRPKEAGAPER